MIAIDLVATTAKQHFQSWLMQGSTSTFSPHSFHFSLLWTARVGRLLSALTDRYSKWELEENKSDWSSGSATERWKQSESTGPPAALEALVQQISQPFFYGNIHLNIRGRHRPTTSYFQEWRLLYWRGLGVFHTWICHWLSSKGQKECISQKLYNWYRLICNLVIFFFPLVNSEILYLIYS